MGFLTAHRRLRSIATAMLMCCLFVSDSRAAHGQDRPSRANQLEAAFFHKFSDYIRWAPSFENAADDKTLCVIGSDPVTELIAELASSSTRKVNLRKLESPAQAEQCLLLYISAEKASNIQHLLSELKNSGVVTVSSIPGFVSQGGMIEFFQEGPHIRFTINQDALESQRVQLSSQLLALSRPHGGR